MTKKLLLSLVTAASLAAGLVASSGTANANHLNSYHHNGLGLGFFFGQPNYYDDGYYNNGFYDDGYYNDYPRFRHRARGCHIGKIRYHHKIHKARICNGRVVRIY